MVIFQQSSSFQQLAPGANRIAAVTGTAAAAAELPVAIRPPVQEEQIKRINATMRARAAEHNTPKYADVVPSLNHSTGLSNPDWMLLEWQTDQIMSQVVGVVFSLQSFTAQNGLDGFSFRLAFDESGQNEAAVHAWQPEVRQRLASLRDGDIIDILRLKVRPQSKDQKGTMPYTLLFNAESRFRLLKRAGAVQTDTFLSIDGHVGEEGSSAGMQPQHQQNNNFVPQQQPQQPLHPTYPIIVEEELSAGFSAAVPYNMQHGDEWMDMHARPEGQNDFDIGSGGGVVGGSNHGPALSDNEDDDDDDEAGNGEPNAVIDETEWLSANRPPPLQQQQQQPPPSGPSSSHRPRRASAICCEQRLQLIVAGINEMSRAVSRDSRNSRDRARRRRLRQRRHNILFANEVEEESADDDVVVLSPRSDQSQTLGIRHQQALMVDDEQFYSGELIPIEEMTANNEMVVVQKALEEEDRKKIVQSSFVMKEVPENAKGLVEKDEKGYDNLTCIICRCWMRDSGHVNINAWEQLNGQEYTGGGGNTHIQHGSGRGRQKSANSPPSPSAIAGNSSTVLNDNVYADEPMNTEHLDRYCHIVGVWERTACRSRNTRCEAIEVSFQGWESANRPDTLLAQCLAGLLKRVLGGRPPPLRIGMS
uniref:HORMA domain-containing protein n=1 Tax=Globodera pallida TaxID=36090 RepID=A0A183C672_GLOPA